MTRPVASSRTSSAVSHPSAPRIAIPQPTSQDPEYNERAWRQYAEAIERSGGVPVYLPLSESQAALARLAGSCSGVLLPGSGADVDPEKYGEAPIPECGPKDAARESADDLLLQDAFNLGKPVLGVCYGMQSLNVWRDGKLIQDLKRNFEPESTSAEGSTPRLLNHAPGRDVERAHWVTLAPESLLSGIVAEAADLEGGSGALRLPVNSSHHQAVRTPGDHLRIVARSPEDGVIEALEGAAPREFVLGVQWHPERTYQTSAASRAIFDAFVRAAARWRPRAIRESVADPAAE